MNGDCDATARAPSPHTIELCAARQLLAKSAVSCLFHQASKLRMTHTANGPPLRLTSLVSLALISHGSTGRDWPGNPPRSGVLSAGGVLPVEDWDPAPPLSGTDARWH